MNFISVNEINTFLKNDLKEFIAQSEDKYRRNLVGTADKIAKSVNQKPVVLISGPSGSGKTTSALRLGKLLKHHGLDVNVISLDNYFLPMDSEKLRVDENGNIDLEAPDRLDLELLHEHIGKIIKNEEIQIPFFDFKEQKTYKFEPYKRPENAIVIFEGIHALNPSVIGDAGENATSIYVSVRTRIKNSNDEFLHPKRIRLLRRLIRDKIFRGREIPEIFEMFQSVSEGEEKYIMPYKPNASFNIDTFIGYEAAAYKTMLWDDLVKAEDVMKDSGDYNRIMHFLKDIDTMHIDDIPTNSIVREFIGGSTFKY